MHNIAMGEFASIPYNPDGEPHFYRKTLIWVFDGMAREIAARLPFAFRLYLVSEAIQYRTLDRQLRVEQGRAVSWVRLP